ncbi:MAG: lycopene cyclase domain-containing protein [Weeksellaceae bacterium]|nr:lycopene cyclase domain-containing protein [Weeksellaceae bacterium]
MEKYLYLTLNLLSFSIPFLFSFERRWLHFIQYFKPYILAIIAIAIPFILWDIWFTQIGVWGFNPRYLTGLDIYNLPIEEILFFILIPYPSNFIHYSLLYFFPRTALNPRFARILALILGLAAIAVAITHTQRLYTLTSFGTAGILLLAQYRYRWPIFNRYILSFLLILIPFILVNGWLTGSYTPEPVVWYNDDQNLGIRVGTIPIEDFFYCFTMLYSSALLFEHLLKKFNYKIPNCWQYD